MKIENVEIGYLPQLGFVQDGYPSALDLNNILSAQVLDDPINVNNIRSDGISEQWLSDREVERMTFRASYRLQPRVKLDH